MGGGLMQLVAVGAQNVFLLGNTETAATFWRQMYTRHTNFAIESIDQVFKGRATYGQRVSCTISRNGDLVSNLVLEVTLKRGSGESFYPAEHLIKEVELVIGGQKIDTITNTWLRIYDELYRKMDENVGYMQMADFDTNGGDGVPTGTVKRFYIPIPFWFCSGDSSTALPLISLQYHEVELHIQFEEAANIPGIDPSHEPEITLWADYVYLDTDERRWFAQTPHEYLIEQTQMFREPLKVDATPLAYNVVLPFNHPVKYLAWVLKQSEEKHGVFSADGIGCESRELCGPLAECGLQLNGMDRFKPRKGSYFRLQHPVAAFGQAPSVGVYVYSFALDPAQPRPTGSLNLSRIDQARLQIKCKAAALANADIASDEDTTLVGAKSLKMVEIYARNHNVLRIMSGMGGLAYSD